MIEVALAQTIGGTLIKKTFSTAFFVVLISPLLVICQSKDKNAKADGEIRQADAEFHRAFQAEDSAALEKLLTTDFLWTHSTGEVWTKGEILGRIRSGKLQYDIAETDDVKVYLYKDTAVVSGHATRRYPGKDTFWLRYTAVYVKVNGKWMAAAFHSSHVPAPDTTK